MYKIIINGSRDFNNYTYLRLMLKEYIMTNQINPESIEIISGGAKGADTLAIKFAKEYNLNYKVMNADWNKYGKRAGIIRNAEMLTYAISNPNDIAILISFWNGTSKGTKHMIDISNDKGIIVKVMEVGD
jgi:hypothetical protein